MSRNVSCFSYLLLLIFIISCSKPDINESSSTIINIEGINVPDEFDYKTYRAVSINIKDNAPYVMYDVFAYSETPSSFGFQTFENQVGEIETEEVFKNDVMSKLIFSGVPENGVLEQLVNVPTYCDKIYIRRNENLKFSSSIQSISNGQVNYTYTTPSERAMQKTEIVNDYLYCVNGSGELFQVDPLTGLLTYLSDMPMGSYTCAIDQANKLLFSIGRSSPYPLMKYSIEGDTWETVANLGVGGPRLDFNIDDGLLYFSKNDKLYTFDPLTGANLNIWDINGLHSTIGGDLAFAEDGKLFLCTFSGLYLLELNQNNTYDSTRISADNLPFQPTSMTFDSNQELWLANSASSSDLIIMDTQSGGWQYQYGVNAGNNTDFGRTINDLTTFRVFSESNDDTDTDGDGILDRDDSYPSDPDKAFEVFTPSKYGKGTIAFEDLWPSNGDYDFNDLALNYQAIAILNSNNLVVQVDFICRIKSNSAGYTNGIGIQIDGLDSSHIQNVVGTVYSENYINLKENNTEDNQDKAVIIFTDNADNLLSENTISIIFNEPLSTETLGAAPFNPFIISNMIRENEIHLPYYSTTDLGDNLISVSGLNNDANGDYISDNGYPWAISIIHDFKVPKESIRINDAYNFFANWATSGGLEFKDWYKDNPGNRNDNLLKD